MFFKIICAVIFASSALSRNVPNFNDLDEEDQMLFRAAYDSYETQSYTQETQYPSYNVEPTSYNYPSYSQDNEIPIGKLDLLKDGMWALKAKMKELKAFNKALAANLLSTKLKVKELLMEHQMKPLKKHQHVEVDKKPAYNYQPSPPPSYSQYEHPHPQYASSATHYNLPVPQYNAPAKQYTIPGPQYTASGQQYTAPASQNTPTAQHYEPPQHAHDPYYGH